VETAPTRHNIAQERQVILMHSLKFASLLRKVSSSSRAGAISAFRAAPPAPHAVLLWPATSSAVP